MNFIARITYNHIIKWTFCVFFLFVSIEFRAQEKINNPKQAMRIERTLNSITPDTSKVNRFLKLAEFYRTVEPKSQSNTSKAVRYVNNAIATSQKISFRKGIGNAYLVYSRIEQDRKDFNKTIDFAKKATVYFKAINEYNLMGESQVMQWSGSTLSGHPIDERAALLNEACSSFGKALNRIRQGDCMKEMGDLYQYNSRYSESLPKLKQALSYYVAGGKKDLFPIYDLLGSVYSSLGDYREGLRYGLLAVRNAERQGEKGQMLCTIFNRIGITYYSVEDYPKAILYFDKAMDIAIRNLDLPSIYLIYSEKASILIYSEKNKEAKAFLDSILKKYPELTQEDPVTPLNFYLTISHKLGHKKEAAAYFDQLEKLLIETNSVRSGKMLNVYEGMLNYLIETKDFSKAAYYNAIYQTEMNRMEAKGINVMLFQFKIDSIAGNYVSAIKSLQMFKKAYDEISNKETIRQISQLNILYETEKKDRDISHLTKTTEEQQQNLQRAKKIRSITFIALTLVVVILLLSVLGYFQKKKTNRLLHKKQQDINEANKALQHLLTEKEWLLREIHHRVKNNLHMVSGLLASQTEFIKGEEALQAITDSQHRVQAMSIIHQKLYQTETLSHINMATYVNELTEYLDGSFRGHCPVKFRLDIDSVDFPLSHSIPVGLIINEAVTNSIKYAFDVCGDCFISVLLKNTQSNDYLLQIQDNGIGMPENFNISESNSLGMRLIEGLSNDIQADLKIYNENGSVIELRFTLTESNSEKIAS